MIRTVGITFTVSPPPDYDIALLRLKEPLVFDEEVSPICLPGSLNLTGTNAAVTKWGLGDDYYERYIVDRIMESPVGYLLISTECLRMTHMPASLIYTTYTTH